MNRKVFFRYLDMVAVSTVALVGVVVIIKGDTTNGLLYLILSKLILGVRVERD